MKTSTFPPSRSSAQSVRDGLKEIQVKRKALMNLEVALKAKIDEFRELCLKEGVSLEYLIKTQNKHRNHSTNHVSQFALIPQELTGQLPVDYPLQPREPLPQIRRRQPNISIKGIGKFQPYYEETKPFQMSDFYKYSSKHRMVVGDGTIPESCKTTRQLQQEVLKKQTLNFSNFDDQIMASVKVIERNGQELMKATAEAIALNPDLAEKLNHILPKSQV